MESPQGSLGAGAPEGVSPADERPPQEAPLAELGAGEQPSPAGGAAGRATPVLLSLVFLGLIVGPAIYRLLQFQTQVEWIVGGGGVLLYALWQAYESRISVAELHKDEALHDAGTMPLAALAKLILLMAALLGGGVQRYELGAAAALIFLLGAGLRTHAIHRLKGDYSHRIRRPPLLVTDGVFGLVRHPAYAGTLLAHAAVPLFFPNPYALAAFWGAWLPAVLVRTVVEDRFLRRDLGAEYEAYAARTKRLIPGIW